MRTLHRFLWLLPALVSINASAKQPAKGYRGFAEWINDVKDDMSIYGGASDSRYYTGASVSQGYQFNPFLFVGGGIAVEQCVKDNRIYSAPVFGQIRTDLKFGKFTPFADVRLGYNFANYGGIYFSPSIGYRIGLSSKLGLNIGVGWSMTGNRNNIKTITTILGPNGQGGTNSTEKRVHQYDNTIALRLGIDFQPF